MHSHWFFFPPFFTQAPSTDFSSQTYGTSEGCERLCKLKLGKVFKLVSGYSKETQEPGWFASVFLIEDVQ